jgi:hypothetical protein
MEIDKGDILSDLQDLQDQADGMGFAANNENDLWRRELIADYIVKKLTIRNVSESLVCHIYGCVNIRNKEECFCDEHLID